jgi:hypothetical protein
LSPENRAHFRALHSEGGLRHFSITLIYIPFSKSLQIDWGVEAQKFAVLDVLDMFSFVM